MKGPRNEAEDQPRGELFVRSIPTDATEEQLSAFFSDIAPVRHAVLVKDKESGESRGFGFVSFASHEDAKAALEECKSRQFKGRRLAIDYAKRRERQNAPDNKKSELDLMQNKERRKPRLIVRNVPWSLRNPNDLVKIFSKYGKVVDAYIPRGENNKMSGFAFVTMRRKLHAKKAIEESKGLEIHGRPVAVDFAIQKDKWQNGEREALDDSESESESEDESEPKGTKDNEEDAEDGDEEDGEEDDGDESKDDFPDLDLDAESDAFTDEEEEKEEEKPRGPRGLDDEHTVFVRNVPYDATKESLEDHFSQFGPVAYALPVMDKKLNQPKGVAFVAFKNSEDSRKCVATAPAVTTSSLLVPDDVDSRYVYEGRILSVAQAVQRERAEKLSEKRANERLAALGKEPRQRDKRHLFLMNEGRIASDSKLAQLLTPSDLAIREKSFQLRRQQLQKNPTLHLSMTRLAIRNLPRSMTEKALKALGRKAVVQFASEVAAKERQPLSKEEVMRSVHYQDSLGETAKSAKKHGVVKQAKVVQEIKDSGTTGRSRGYGFLEMKNHKAALMALRWLNAHLVTKEEIAEGLDEKSGPIEQEKKKHLVVEFAIENAQVVKRQRERQERARETSKKRKAAERDAEEAQAAARQVKADEEAAKARKNHFVGRKRSEKKRQRRS